jgi:hypothetical protein
MARRQERTTRYLGAVLLFVMSGVPCGAASGKGAAAKVDVPATHPLHIYRALIPLGSEVFSYSNEKQREVFYVMACAQNGEFAGDQLWLDGEKRVLKSANGGKIENYPRQISFRVSVSERGTALLSDSPLSVENHGSTFDQFISGLKFEVKVFHALKARIVRPTKVANIGPPPEMPSSERIYQVTFDLGEVPISDRMVMHVLTSEGERLAKFNLDLY